MVREHKKHHISFLLEEIFLVLVILLNVFDFIKVLPDHIDFIKKVISFTLLGYLMYHVSFSYVLFGKKHVRLDLLIIFSFMLLVMKNITGFALSLVEESVSVGPFYEFLVVHAASIEVYSFYAGCIGLLLISLYVAIRFRIYSPSFLQIIHEEGAVPKDVGHVITRFLTIFLSLIAAFVGVFNLVMEWLTIAVDASLLMFGVLFYLFVIVRFHKHYGGHSLLFKIGNFGEDFFERFVNLFHSKKTVFLGMGGILAFHLITDIGVFVIPYVTGFMDPLYFQQLGAGHSSLLFLFMGDLAFGNVFILGLLYLGNILAMVFFLGFLPFVWYKLFMGKPLHTNRWILAFMYSAVFVYAFFPIFTIRKIVSTSLVGVDVMTSSVYPMSSWMPVWLPVFVSMFALVLGVFIHGLEKWKSLKKELFLVAILFSVVFFSVYIWLYFISNVQYYTNTVVYLLHNGEPFIGSFLLLFGAVTQIMYVGGYFVFLYEIYKEAKRSD